MLIVGVAFGGEGRGTAEFGTRPPDPPPVPAPLGSSVDGHGLPLPALARVRVGDARWTAGTGAQEVALSPDGARLVVAGRSGLASFDAASGRLVEQHIREDISAVAVLPDGRVAWVGDSGVKVGARLDIGRCPDPERSALGVTAAGELVGTCEKELWVAAPGGTARAVAFADLDNSRSVGIAGSPDGQVVVWHHGVPGGFRVPLDGGAVTPIPGLLGAAYRADGRFAAWFEDRVEVDGRRLPLRLDGPPRELALASEGDGVVVAAGLSLHVVEQGKRKCTVTLEVAPTSLAFGRSIWVGTQRGTTPLRVDPATCAVEEAGLPEAPTVMARFGNTLVVGGDSFLASWDHTTGAALGRAALDHVTAGALTTVGGALGVVDPAKARVTRVHELPTLKLRSAEAPDAPGLRSVLPLEYGMGWHPPDDPVAAASPRGDVAAGLELLTVHVGGETKVFDLGDQVHLDLTNPTHFDDRPVSSKWDPANVRPDGLWLTTLAFGADGLLAAGLEFQVRDAWGGPQVKRWLGVLDPARETIAGVPERNNLEIDAVALSDHGEALAWLTEWGLRVLPLPSRTRPPPPPPPPPDLASQLFSEPRGGVREGDAQRLSLTGLFEPDRLQGRPAAVALSGDGRLVAAATDREAAVWQVGTKAPVWRHDLGQGGTMALSFSGDELWVLGRDGTVLVLVVK